MASFKRSFKYAKRGFLLAIKRERNMRIHFMATGVVLVVAVLGRVPAWSWVCLLLCCGLVLAAEFLNSALETLCDRVQPQIDPFIRDCKDIAAGGVLVCAGISVVVGGIIFLQPDVITELISRPFELSLLALLCPVLFYLISIKSFK